MAGSLYHARLHAIFRARAVEWGLPVTHLNADLYDALRSAGADDAVARKAAESVRAPDQLSERIDGLDKRLGILMWMVGLNIGCTIGLYALLFRVLP